MKPINIYALTRLSEPTRLERLERQMSKRKTYLKIKEWELDGLRALCERLEGVMEEASTLNFYYSFVMPKLGKEFDLLRVNEEFVVNVELKSGNVSDETIRNQLLQNRYYLATLGKSMYFYTYISNIDRLVRLSNSGHLVQTDWEELAKVLERQRECYTGHIEELFKEDKYLISPLTDPGRFLRQEYFLTFQQKDIKKQILRRLDQEQVQGFTGFPGTGKTILLYDIAMQLSGREKVCVFHFGAHAKELEHLNERLKRIDFFYYKKGEHLAVPRPYSAICVDEGHKVDQTSLQEILEFAKAWNAPVIISYDREDALAPEERRMVGADLIEAIPGFVGYRLTNRIRLNNELSTFIRSVMYVAGGGHRSEYPSVSLAYATDEREARKLLHNYEKEGYIYIWDDAAGRTPAWEEENNDSRIAVSRATGKEYAKVVMCIDRDFAYDEQGYLRYLPRDAGEREALNVGGESKVRNLFHGLSRAKEKIALVVEDNEIVFDRLLGIVQKIGDTHSL